MRAFAAFFVLLLVVGCQAPPVEMTEAEIAQIEAEVMEWLREGAALVREYDRHAVRLRISSQ